MVGDNKRSAFAVLVVAVALGGCGPREVSFSKDVMPILQASCLECHKAGGEGQVKTGLQLDSYDNLMKGTRFGAVVKPGSGLSSPFNQVVEGRVDASIRMPHGGKQMPPAQTETLRNWVDQGAKNN